MGLSYSIESGLVTVLAEGSFGVDTVRSTFSEIRAEIEPSARVRILILDRGSEFDPTQEELRRLVHIWSELFRGLSIRIALLVEKELHYGLGRIASVYAEGQDLPFRVFRRRSVALEWLAPEEPEPAA